MPLYFTFQNPASIVLSIINKILDIMNKICFLSNITIKGDIYV